MLQSKCLSLFLALLLSYGAVEMMSCTKEVASPCEVTYDNEVKSIMANTCAYAGCHSGPTASPYVPAIAKDYTTYDGLKETVENGMFRERAINIQNMPPDAFVPDGRPLSLTSDEMSSLQCWLDSGYPEK